MASENIYKDIFEAVFLNVKRSFLENYDITRVKSRTVEQAASEEENLKSTTAAETATRIDLNTRDASDSVTETVKESVERVSEDDVISDIRAFLEEKFPFALAAVCNDLRVLDVSWRKFCGLAEQATFSGLFIDVTDEFPLSERFVYPVVMFISSMVLIDVNEKRSDAFYGKYADAVAKICAETPFEVGSTVQKYT